MRLIDVDALIERIKAEKTAVKSEPEPNDLFERFEHRVIPRILQNVIDFLELQPTIEAESVKQGKWVVNPESYDGFKHHMCSKCKNDAIFDSVYEADFDEMLDGEWDYVGQRESGISEHLTKRCNHCDAKMDVADTNAGDKEDGE